MSDQTPIPFTPEPLTSLKARYAAALRVTFNSEHIIAGRQKPPGEMHANIFDTTCGIRLIVSREIHPDQPPETRRGIHISASVAPGSVEGDRLARIAQRDGPVAALAELATLALADFRIISGDIRRIVHVGVSDEKGIPHWYIWENETC
jgi:hypothetical protein